MGRFVGAFVGLVALLCAAGPAYADGPPPKIVVVTGNGATMQTASSRNPNGIVDAPAAVYPTAVAGVSASRPAPAPQTAAVGAGASAGGALDGMSREQIGDLVRSAANTIPPETMGCLVQASADGMAQGLLPRDLNQLGAPEIQWLASRCNLTMSQLAPLLVDYLAGPAAPTPAPAAPTAQAPRATYAPPAPPVDQQLQAMRAAAGTSRSDGSPLNTLTVGLLGVGVGGALGAGIGLGHLLGQAKPGRARVPAQRRRPAGPGYRYTVHRPPPARPGARPGFQRGG